MNVLFNSIFAHVQGYLTAFRFYSPKHTNIMRLNRRWKTRYYILIIFSVSEQPWWVCQQFRRVQIWSVNGSHYEVICGSGEIWSGASHCQGVNSWALPCTLCHRTYKYFISALPLFQPSRQFTPVMQKCLWSECYWHSILHIHCIYCWHRPTDSSQTCKQQS